MVFVAVASFVLVVVAILAIVESVQRPDVGSLVDLGLERHGSIYSGTFQGLSVEVGLPSDSGGPVERKLVVRPFVSPEYLGPHPLRPLGPLVRTGDDEFDRAIALCGSEAAIRGALDAATRASVRRHAVSVRYGQLEGHYMTSGAVQRFLQVAVDLHRRFECTPEERLAQLEENVRRDPHGGVRARSLDTLARVPGGLERADALAREQEIDESLRIRAAILAGSSDVLTAFAASTPDGVVLAAVTEALGSIGSRDCPRALERVRDFVRTSPIEPLIRVLGRYGGVADVPLLTAIRGPGPLRAASREAIRSIQGRVFGSDAGAIGFAEGEGGELAEAEVGGLAVTRTEKGDPPS
jgi:hypothetical protein